MYGNPDWNSDLWSLKETAMYLVLNYNLITESRLKIFACWLFEKIVSKCNAFVYVSRFFIIYFWLHKFKWNMV